MTGDAARFAVGIDLGTTHCVMASAALDHPVVRRVDVPQLVAPGELAERELLPSFLYLPANGELSDADRALPWGSSPHVVGELARRMGGKVPARLVASAKSWVCHGGVNRRAPILPWNSPESLPHISPYQAQVRYLEHLRHTWQQRHPGVDLAAQDVVVTVPASFDEGARTLTAEAAAEAGLGEVRLLEEPQAAFYDYLGDRQDELDRRLGDARLVLVVDVGGGTTDLTLLRVRSPAEREGDPDGSRFERIAVGGHLMLGGDNMDAALAMHALEQAGLPRPEDATVWSALVHSARDAKERLLGHDAPEQAVISYVGRGSRLLSNTRSLPIDRERARSVLLDGFMPHSGPTEIAQRSGRAGLTTLGLPYTTDTAIGRHICTFLRRHAQAAHDAGATVIDDLPRPDRLLLNGGVFNAPAMIERLREVIGGWYGADADPIALLEHTSLDTAVAHGAVRAALARRGVGAVIGGGTARAYYIGVEDADGTARALCVAPRGMEEGTQAVVPDRVFDLRIDQRVSFPLHAYTGDRSDAPGTLIELGDDEALSALPPLQTVLRDRGGKTGAEARTVPVTLDAALDERGALALFLTTVELPPRKWKLEFVLRATDGDVAATDPNTSELPPPAEGTDEACTTVAAAFGDDDPKPVKNLRRALEKQLGPRSQWSLATCRALADALLEASEHRGRSDQHELHWLRLCGFCLRPGFGAPGDDARRDALWELRATAVQQTTKANWAEWWIAWRRIVPGLDDTQQRWLFDEVRPWLWRKGQPPAGPHRHGPAEMMQLLATLETLDPADKEQIGELLLTRAKKLGTYWPLGRVGARVLVRGGPDRVVAPAVAERWLGRLLELDWAKAEGASFAAASIAALTGDTERDVSPSLRNTVAKRLSKADAPNSWIEMVTQGAALSEGDLRRVLGDSLPTGLRLT